MFKDCIPFKKKALYLVLTIPIVIIFILIVLYLWQTGLIPFIIYCCLFLLVIMLQSYCCAYQDCPYIGKFCPGIGGITILSSVIALLWKNTKRSEKMFNLFASIGFSCLIGIVVFPLFFIYKLGIFVLISYLVIAIFYCITFFALICPFCAIRDTCPGGKIAGQIF
jgi:hypothetical protein